MFGIKRVRWKKIDLNANTDGREREGGGTERIVGSIGQALYVVSVPWRDEVKRKNGMTERIER